MSLELITALIPSIKPFLDDSEISEIMINGSTRTVFLEKAGRMYEASCAPLEEQDVYNAMHNLASLLKLELSERKPQLAARLPDGSRVTVTIPPVSVGGTTVNIRKFQERYFSTHELVANGTVPAEQMEFLQDAVRSRKNILVSGAMGSGKTTLMGALCRYIPANERLAVLEKTKELHIEHRNVFRGEERPAINDIPSVQIADMLPHALRQNVNRIIIGELTGSEAWDFLESMNIGHPGGIASLHANDALDTIPRFLTLVMKADVARIFPFIHLCEQIGNNIDLLVHMSKRPDETRCVDGIVQVKGYDRKQVQFDVEDIYRL